jgi:hypothetical protein
VPYHRILGTPTESSWPGIQGLPDYKPTFPQWSQQDLARVVPALDTDGLDMLMVRLQQTLFSLHFLTTLIHLHAGYPRIRYNQAYFW